MNELNKISVFSNYYGTKPLAEISVRDYCQGVKDGEFASEIETLRKITDKVHRDKFKATLPAMTISGTFKHREKVGLIKASGFVCIDLDQKGNPHITDWPELRNQLSKINNIYFVALSASGKGVFAIIPVFNPDQHEKHILSLQIDFRTLGLEIDMSCTDISRLRGISSDPDAIFHQSPETYRRMYVYEPPKTAIRHFDTGKSIDLIIKKIIAAGVDITSDYNNWFEIGRALVNEYGEGGRSIFHEISQYYKDYKPEICDKQYTACVRSPGKATGATIFEIAKQYNILLKQ